MARRASNAELPPPPAKGPSSFWRGVRMSTQVIAGATLLVGCVWAAVRVEQFVIGDKQFVMQGPPEPGVPSEFFEILGRKHAPEQKIVDVFQRDFGRSIYLCPIEERRRRMLAIDWIKDVAITRIWPNRIVVHVTERVPVAFAQTPGLNGTMFYTLVDAEGVLLDPQHAGQMALPVLSGFPVNASEQVRHDRMKRFLRMQSELGQLMDKVSEIDVSEPDNLKITQEFEGRALTLLVGNQQFLLRYQNFLDNYAEIRHRLPDATVLDLRLKDRITAVGQAEETAAPKPAAREGLHR